MSAHNRAHALPQVATESLTVRLQGTTIVSEIDVVASPGQITGIIGPNGSGKSTLLRTIYRHLKPSAGRVLVGDDDIAQTSAAVVARTVAAVPQERETDFEVTVREVVALGRLPHQRPFAGESSQDRRLIEQSLAKVGMERFASRTFASLSGGERQRALLARCLAQGGRVLVLDEPTNHLDVSHQIQLLGLLRQSGLTTVITLHDLNAAAAVCDRLHVLCEGRLVASGTPRQVLTPDLLDEVFEVRAAVIDHPLCSGLLVAIDNSLAEEPGTHRPEPANTDEPA